MQGVRSIVEDAESYLNESVEEVIISVPAYFMINSGWRPNRPGLLPELR